MEKVTLLHDSNTIFDLVTEAESGLDMALESLRYVETFIGGDTNVMGYDTQVSILNGAIAMIEKQMEALLCIRTVKK